MEADSFAVRTALFLLGTIALLVASVVLLRGNRVETVPYVIHTRESVSGLEEQSRAYYKGVEVGYVESIGFTENDYNQVRILLQVDETIPLGTNTYAQLSLRGITGEYDLTLDNEGELGEPLVTSDAEPARIPMRTELITRLSEILESMLEELRQVSANLQKMTDEETRAEMRRLIGNAADLSERLISLQEQASGALSGVPDAVDSFQTAMNEVRSSADALNQRTANLDDLLETMTTATGSLDQLLLSIEGQTLTEVDETLLSLRSTLRELTQLADLLQREPQSLLLGPAPAELGPGETLEPPP